MKTLKAVNEIKDLMVGQRSKLIKEKSQLMKRWKSGVDYFSHMEKHTPHDNEQAAALMRDISAQLDSVTKQIYDLDIIIGSKLELLFNDCEVRIFTKASVDDSGEKIDAQSILVSFDDNEAEAITPNDLWCLKILRPALRYNNIQIVRKE